ncbi:MAG: flagellar basal body P-ring formation chaperone FlgA, partial [Hyphomicrobiales bacterium]
RSHRPAALALLAAVLLGAAALPPSPADAQGAPVLREQVRVHAPVVTLGDLFENAGSSASTPVFLSPDLGTQGVVAARRIAAAALQHGLVWENPGGIHQVSVQRPSRLVTLDEVRDAIAAKISHDLGLTDAKSLTILLNSGGRAFHVDSRITGSLLVKRVDINDTSGAFRATVGFDDMAAQAQDVTFSGRSIETEEIALPVRIIERGAVITENDLETTRVARTQIPTGVLRDMKELVGMAAKRQLSIGQAVRRSDIEKPRIVERNALVTIVYRVPGMVLRTQGRALDSAAIGESVAILNIQSKRTIQATVDGPGLVSVNSLLGPGPQVASQSTGTGGGNRQIVR